MRLLAGSAHSEQRRPYGCTCVQRYNYIVNLYVCQFVYLCVYMCVHVCMHVIVKENVYALNENVFACTKGECMCLH